IFYVYLERYQTTWQPLKSKVRYKPKAHGNSSKNGTLNVSISSKDGPNKQPAKVVDIPLSSSTRKGGSQIPTSSSNIPTSNPYDLLSQEYNPENYKRSGDDLESEKEFEVVYDESDNLRNSTKTWATYMALDVSRT
ncbi:hypothetical protein Tco_0500614, partial [Tanacetum coccineum]